MLDNNLMILSLIHLISTAIIVGIIWVIQVVHYPSFYFIERDEYVSFQKFHMDKISYIVVPVMLIESISGFILIYNELNTVLLISMILLFFIWVLTGTFFVPIHQNLTSGYQEELVEKLVKINWVRTIFWTIRLLLVTVYLSSFYNS